MANTGTDGTQTPDAEDGNEQQNEEDRRRQTQTRWYYGNAGEPVGVNEQVMPQPTRPNPGVAAAHTKSEALPSDWRNVLAERLTKLNDTRRDECDRQIRVMTQSNLSVSPNYQLALANLLTKELDALSNVSWSRLHFRLTPRAADVDFYQSSL